MIPSAWRAGELAVIGLARSGEAACRLLRRHGVVVYASDSSDDPTLQATKQRMQDIGVAVELGRHDLSRVRRASAVVVSPGVHPDAPALVAAREAGVPIISELDLGLRANQTARVIAVTGTNGKTTTAAMIGHLLQEAGRSVAVAGNIGRPVTEVVAASPPRDWLVVEASSFQLHDAPTLAPAIGVLTNLSPDHLDRYESLEAYYADKARLFSNADESSSWVLNHDDPAVRAMVADVPGTRSWFSLRAPADAWYRESSADLVLAEGVELPQARFPLLGRHNVANALAATLAARSAGVRPDVVARALQTTHPVPHRLEPVRRIDDVRWINDSKATNMSSAVAAVEAMETPFVLIVGGRYKGDAIEPLAGALRNHCRLIIAYGESAGVLGTALREASPVEVVDRFDAAVLLARERSEPGDTVLLAPACASFDQFPSYEARGNRFREIVEAW